MKRWLYFLLCLIFGGALFATAWFIPAHLRALDAAVMERAGEGSAGLVERGLSLVENKNAGAAEFLWRTANQEQVVGQEKLRAEIDRSLNVHPEWRMLGVEPRLKLLLEFSHKPSDEPQKTNDAFTPLIIQAENRGKSLAFLSNSPSLTVQRLLRCRSLTNTVLFPSSQSSAGQAFDAALVIGGLLLEEQRLTRTLTDSISSMASAALEKGNSQQLEQVLLDFLSLGQRFNWGQLVAFCEQVLDAETLRLQANLARKSDAQLPVLFSAVQLSGQPAAVAKYLMTFGQTGQKDLAASLHSGAGGLNELLKRNRQLHRAGSKLNTSIGGLVHLAWQMPELALGLKWLLFLSAGFFVALALHFGRPLPPVAERPFHVPGFHLAREILFALGFLLVVLLLSEPFLTQESQKVEFPIRLRLPTVGSAVPAETSGAQGSFMNQLSLLTLLLFFVLQALLYVACLVKLAEIRRQTFPSNIKLKLLENEEHLFDAGLYLGFAGTIISLILVSVGVIKPSLMAAYSSTSFGVIFVSIFKIFHLRPLRRKFLLEAEAEKKFSTQPAEHPLAAPL